MLTDTVEIRAVVFVALLVRVRRLDAAKLGTETIPNDDLNHRTELLARPSGSLWFAPGNLV